MSQCRGSLGFSGGPQSLVEFGVSRGLVGMDFGVYQPKKGVKAT